MALDPTTAAILSGIIPGIPMNMGLMSAPLTAEAQARTTQIARTIYVGNLPPHLTAEQMVGVFQSCGPIIQVRMATQEGMFGADPTKAKFGFIEFATLEAAQIARNLSGITLVDRNIKVSDAKAPIIPPSGPNVAGSYIRLSGGPIPVPSSLPAPPLLSAPSVSGLSASATSLLTGVPSQPPLLSAQPYISPATQATGNAALGRVSAALALIQKKAEAARSSATRPEEKTEEKKRSRSRSAERKSRDSRRDDRRISKSSRRSRSRSYSPDRRDRRARSDSRHRKSSRRRSRSKDRDYYRRSSKDDRRNRSRSKERKRDRSGSRERRREKKKDENIPEPKETKEENKKTEENTAKDEMIDE